MIWKRLPLSILMCSFCLLSSVEADSGTKSEVKSSFKGTENGKQKWYEYISPNTQQEVNELKRQEAELQSSQREMKEAEKAVSAAQKAHRELLEAILRDPDNHVLQSKLVESNSTLSKAIKNENRLKKAVEAAQAQISASTVIKICDGFYREYDGQKLTLSGNYSRGKKVGEWISYKSGVATKKEYFDKKTGIKERERDLTKVAPKLGKVSVTGSLFRFSPSGEFSTFTPSIGFGLARKFKPKDVDFDLGLYLAPQITKKDSLTTARVSLIVYASLFGDAQLGVGADIWDNDNGFTKEGLFSTDSNRLFFTLGWKIGGDGDKKKDDSNDKKESDNKDNEKPAGRGKKDK